MPATLCEMESWATGNLLERRAAVAGLCEPSLLREPDDAAAVLAILDRVTAGISHEEDCRSEGFRVLRKALGYRWSVAVAAQTEIGKSAMASWLTSDNRDIRGIMRENLKMRLSRMDDAWVQHAVSQMAASA